MQPRILKGSQAEFVRSNLSEAKAPGFAPIGTSVLVLMDECAPTSSGGIHLPPEKIAQMNLAAESGVIVDIGEAAFRYYDDGSKWTGRKPKAGDRVVVERYAGRELQGQDGRMYRMMTYTSIGGIELPQKPKSNRKRG